MQNATSGSSAGRLTRSATALCALAIVAVLYGFARPTTLPADERRRLAAPFQFATAPLAEIPGLEHRIVRTVHPSLQHLSAWISSVGAAIALGDADGDGLPNDTCHVDPRTDVVTVAPLPGSGARYAPFRLDAAPLRYDASTMAPMGCLLADINEDGLMDATVYYWGRTPVAFLAKGTAAGSRLRAIRAVDFVPVDLVPGEERWFTNAATYADLDGDGHADLLVANYFADGSRILDAHAGGVERMHDTKSRSFTGGRRHLLLWVSAGAGETPSVTLQEAKDVFAVEVDRGWTLGVGATDLDGDLLPELYFANDFGPDRLLHNRSTPGHPRFALLEGQRGVTTPKSFVLGHDSFKGMGVDFGDLNEDGIPDIYVSNIAAEFALQESHFLWLSTGDAHPMLEGLAPYEQASERLGLSRSGWGWESRLADFDNDGRLEAIQATGFIKGETNRWPELQALGTGNDRMMSDPRHWPRFRPGDDLSGHQSNAFFVRGADGRFHDIAADVGLGDPVVTRGIATADADGDGRLDVAVANQWEASTFHRNECRNCGAFLGLHLLRSGTGDRVTARSGHPGADANGIVPIGATATVTLPDGRRITAQVDGGTGHSGKRSPDLHFGLGRQKLPIAPLAVELRWRDTEGRTHRQRIDIGPGWHTVQLG